MIWYVSEIISRYERNFSFPLNLRYLARTITRLNLWDSIQSGLHQCSSVIEPYCGKLHWILTVVDIPVSWRVRSMFVDWQVPWNSYYTCPKIGGEQLSSKRNAWRSQFSDYVATEMERMNRDLLAAWNETYSVTLTFVFCKGQYIWAYRNNRQERGCLTGSETGAM